MSVHTTSDFIDPRTAPRPPVRPPTSVCTTAAENLDDPHRLCREGRVQLRALITYAVAPNQRSRGGVILLPLLT